MIKLAIFDLDGTLLEVGSGETVLFSLDGIAYEIDLTDEHAATLRDVLAPYIDAARTVSSRPAGRAPAGGGRRRQQRTGQRDYGPIREWAAKNGYSVSERGRVPAAVLEAYDAAH